MALLYLIYFIVSSLAALLGYYLTSNQYCFIGILVVYLLFFAGYEVLSRRKCRLKVLSHYDLHLFIHDFLIEYQISHSIASAIESGVAKTSKYLKERINMLDEFKPKEKLDNLANYFDSSLYFVFMETVISSCNYVTCLQVENNRIMQKIDQYRSTVKRLVYEFAFTWGMVFIVIALIRLALTNYFNKFATNLVYLSGVIALFSFFLISVYLFDKYTVNGELQYE